MTLMTMFSSKTKKREHVLTQKHSSFIFQNILLNPKAIRPLKIFTLSLLFVRQLHGIFLIKTHQFESRKLYYVKKKFNKMQTITAFKQFKYFKE